MPYRLEADDLDTFDLTPYNGFAVAVIDLGFPEIRGSMSLRPDADGTYDDTSLIGPRAVVLSGTIVPTATKSRMQVLDWLRSFMRPDVRAWLVHSIDGVDERRIRLRPDSQVASIERPTFLAVSAAWVGVDGIQEAAEETVVTVTATETDEAGITFPISFPLTFPATTTAGAVTVTNLGNAYSFPVLQLYGPCENPRIENDTVGRALEFTNLELGDGEFIEIDTRAKTIRLGGLAAQSRYDRLDLDVSEWWSLTPGANDLRYFPESFDEGAEAVITFRSAWL